VTAVANRTRSVWLEAGVVAAIALPLLLLMDAYVRDQPTPRNDELIYDKMASDPFDPHTFPFAYRIAVPLLVHVSPLDRTPTFSLLAWVSCAAIAAVAYVLMRRFDIGKLLSGALAVCLAVSPVLFVVSLRQGHNVDPESVLVMFAGALAIVDRRPLVLAAIVLVGATVREAALFLVPLAYAVWAERLWDAKALRQTLVAAVPGLVAYATVRLAVPSVAREQVIGYGSSLLEGRKDVLETNAELPGTTLRRIVLAFGPLWLVAPFALRDLPFARRGLVLVAFCMAGMLFALDWGRIIFLAAPVIVVAAAWVLNSRPRLAVAVVAAFMAMNLGYMVYMEDFDGAQDGIIDTGPSAYPAL